MPSNFITVRRTDLCPSGVGIFECDDSSCRLVACSYRGEDNFVDIASPLFTRL